MNWRKLFPEQETVLREIEDLKLTCTYEWLKIGFGLFFIVFSAGLLFILFHQLPLTDVDWRLFVFIFSILFSFLMLGLTLLINGLTSNAAKNKRFQDEIRKQLMQLLQGREPVPTGTPTECDMESVKENRELKYSSLILSYVAAIVALIALGNDIWKTIGLPLLLLWFGALFLLIGGPCWIYWRFEKHSWILVIGFICLIGAIIVLILSIVFVLSGSYISTPTYGNVTNFYENTSYPVINVVNNYNVTVTGNWDCEKNSMVSIKEMSSLMKPKTIS